MFLEFFAGRLSAAAIATIEQHVDQCRSCVDLITVAAFALTGGTHDAARPSGPAQASSEPRATLRMISGYRILEPVGYGGMGIVYRAVHVATGNAVALKTVRVHEQGALASIRREIHALSRVHHPGVVRIIEHGIEGGRPWYAMELIEGRPLEGHLHALHTPSGRGDLAPPAAPRLAEILGAIRGLCSTLGYLHGRGVIHRDVTPRNIVIRSDGAPVLIDFGLALRNAGAGRDLLESLARAEGTIAYMAPEQIRGEKLDPRADLYAIGCILYEAVTGQLPFDAASAVMTAIQHVSVAPLPPSHLAPGLDPALEALILRLLEKRPRDRIAYAEDVATALAPFSEPARAPARPDSRQQVYLYRPEFSGRDDLLERSEALLGRADDGRGARMFIAGESGIGKTRLVSEIADRARARGFRVIAGECVALSTHPTHETERSTALHPLRPVLRHLVDLCGGSLARAEHLVGARGRVLAAYEPCLSALPGQHAYPDLPPLSANAARDRLLAALHETIAALADDAPLLLLLDDLQWADQLSLDVLETFPPGFFDEHRVVLIGAYRSDDPGARVERALGAPDVQRVTLARCGGATIRRMAGDMLALDTIPAQLLDHLAGTTEGNPFFASQYLRLAVDESCIVREAGGIWRLGAAGDGEPRLPGSLQALIRRRLDSLSPQARQIIELASVLGRESRVDLLLETSRLTEADALDALSELIWRNFLEEVEGDHVRFVHDKLREVAYDGLAPERASELHRRAALAIERRAGLAPVESALYPTLAHHWACARAYDKAIDYLEKAGDLALERAAHADAAGFFRRAIALEPHLRSAGAGAAPVDPERAARWLRRLGEAYYALGDLPRCEACSSQALSGFGHPLPQSRAGWAAQLFAQLGLQVRHALRPGGDVERAPDRRARLQEAALAAARIAHHYYFTNDALALATVSLLSVNLSERAAMDLPLARPYAQLGYFAGISRLRSLADAYFERARLNAEAANNPGELAVALYHEAAYHVGLGAWSRAHAAGARALRLLGELRDIQETEITHTVLAHAEYCAGDYAASIARCELLFSSARARANVQHEAWGLYASARSLIRLGKLDDALARIAAAQELLRAQPELPSEILCLGLAALARLRQGDLAAAERSADAAMALVDRVSPVFSLGDGYAAAADVYLTLGERRRSRGEALDDALRARIDRACAVLRRFALLFPIGQPSALLADGRAHLLAGRGRRAERCFQRARGRAAALCMPYEEALAALLLARHAQVGAAVREERLRAAESLFDRLRCEPPR
ncbi:serine/threonine-protein kinase [Sorangium sp. So ce1000]|uniref:serine/threonine-protein kinase n=1 Tax=Sorangium sp. So ce1000 TaxID=3133325 RepID=UPI003F63CF37